MKTKLRPRRFGRFLRAREAVSALEYAILVGVVAVGIGGAIALFSGQLADALDTIGDNVTDGVSDTGKGPIGVPPTAPAATPGTPGG